MPSSHQESGFTAGEATSGIGGTFQDRNAEQGHAETVVE